MEKQGIIEILDSLDIQIAMGKIDQNTYNGLRQKWLERLENIDSGTVHDTNQLSPASNISSPGPLSASSTVTVERLTCPECAFPAEIDPASQSSAETLTCKGCGTTYTLQRSQENTQKLKQELKAWLDQMIVGSGYGNSNSIDINARRFIFNETIYPALKKDTDRQLESVEHAPEAPMVQLKLTTGFQDYWPSPLLFSVGQGRNDWLKTLTTRVSAQQLQDFAVSPSDKEKMKILHFRVLSVIYYANIAYRLANPDAAAYKIVSQNLLALQKAYRDHVEEISDESYRSYVLASDSRITGVLLFLEILIEALEQEDGFYPETALAQIDRAIASLNEAENKAIACSYNPLYSIPLQQGIQKDIMVARIFRATVVCYDAVATSQSVEFVPFYESLMNYVRSLTNLQSPNQVLGLLQSMSILLAARAGIEPVRVLADWSWLEPLVEKNRLKPAFGAAETVGNVLRHYHPYWVATLNYAEKSGIIFQSGTGKEALVLIDATSVSTPLVKHLLASDPYLPILQAGMDNFNTLDKQTMALPALLPEDMALHAMKAYANKNSSQLGATIVKMIGLIYLPVAFVRYAGKKEAREVLMSRLNFVNQDLSNQLTQTDKFLRQYGA